MVSLYSQRAKSKHPPPWLIVPIDAKRVSTPEPHTRRPSLILEAPLGTDGRPDKTGLIHHSDQKLLPCGLKKTRQRQMWCSGNIQACQACARGSIPLFCILQKNGFAREESPQDRVESTPESDAEVLQSCLQKKVSQANECW